MDPNSSDPNASSLPTTALFGPACFGSTGGYCTIDTIILNATPTNPASQAWSNANASARADAVEDADSVVQSGCDLANATGGTWEGPWGFQCASLGLNGTLNYTGTTENETPGLDRALRSVGLGSGAFPLGRPAAVGGPPPMFQVVLPSGVRPAPLPNATTSCTRLNGSSARCPAAPIIETVGSDVLLGWNWSASPSGNWMARGDRWSASIDVSVVSLPSNGTAVDLCDGPSCLAAGAGLPTGGLWSGSEASLWPGGPIERTSFPLLEVRVIAPYPLGGALTVHPSQGLENLRVTLTCVLSGGVPPFHFAWLFGNGNTGTTTVATTLHVYPHFGNYSAAVLISDSAMATARATAIVQVYGPLEVNGTAAPRAGMAPLVVTLEASFQGGLPRTT